MTAELQIRQDGDVMPATEPASSQGSTCKAGALLLYPSQAGACAGRGRRLAGTEGRAAETLKAGQEGKNCKVEFAITRFHVYFCLHYITIARSTVESFYRTHQYLLSHLSTSLVRRGLMDEINWNERLIGIKGSRGVGKTTFMLSCAKELYGTGNRECLYVNLNHFVFTVRTLADFVEQFHSSGGKTLFIDQVFKYPGWSAELKACYNRFPDLKIVFTGPSVIRLKEENPDLSDKVAVYHLRGFSFREYLNLANGTCYPACRLQDILHDHRAVAVEVAGRMKEKLQADFKDYLHHGFYPFFLEKRNYSENLLKTMNMTLEVDVLYIRQIEQRYLPKLRKLLYLISLDAPCTPNVSRLSKALDMSRATVMNYIKYLKDARLVNMLYNAGEEFPKKPSRIYIYNTNLLHVVNQQPVETLAECKTFFYNQLQKDGDVREGIKNTDFTVDGAYGFCIKENRTFRNHPDCFYAVKHLDTGDENVVPLWLFGFLY
jgi:predicted AAA+ superfamily ATPase